MALCCRLDERFGVVALYVGVPAPSEDLITVIVAPLSVLPLGTAGGFLLCGGAGGGLLCLCDCGWSDADEVVEVGDGVDISGDGM